MVNVLFSGITFAAICIAGVLTSCQYCYTHQHSCMQLHTTSYVHPLNNLDSLLVSLVGKRTLGLLYTTCYHGCLPDAGEKYTSHGRTYVKVSTQELQIRYTYMWAYASDVTLKCQNPTYDHHHHHHYLITSKPTTASTKATPTTVTTTPTTVTTTSTTTTVPISTTIPVCDKMTVLSAVMHHEQEVNQKAASCADGTHTQSDAVLMNFCNAPSTTSWIKGKQVMNDCSSIPLYAPIASFTYHFHQATLKSAGVFVGCDTDGFKMMSQKCSGALEVTNVTNSIAGHFYVVHW